MRYVPAMGIVLLWLLALVLVVAARFQLVRGQNRATADGIVLLACGIGLALWLAVTLSLQ